MQRPHTAVGLSPICADVPHPIRGSVHPQDPQRIPVGRNGGIPHPLLQKQGGGGGEDAAPRGSRSVTPPTNTPGWGWESPGGHGWIAGGGGGVKPHPPPAEPPPPGAPDSDFGLSSLGQSPSFARCQNGHGSVCTASWSPGNVINRGVIPAAARFGSVSPSAFGITNFGAVNGAGRPRSPPCRGAADPEPLQVAGPGPGPGRGLCPGDGSLREMAARPLRPPYREPTPYDSTSP